MIKITYFGKSCTPKQYLDAIQNAGFRGCSPKFPHPILKIRHSYPIMMKPGDNID